MVLRAISSLKIQKGFTLIEIITTISVLAILATSVIVILNPLEQINKSVDSRRKKDLGQIQRALEIYYQDCNHYPPATEDFKITHDCEGFETVDWGGDWRPYMDVLPIDPKSSKNYAYWSDSNGQSYVLYASLERSNDEQVCNGGAQCTNAGGISCGGICNYGVSSANISP